LSSCKTSKDNALLEAVSIEDYRGSHRLIAIGRTLTSYHYCVFDENEAQKKSTAEKSKIISKAQAIDIASTVIEENLPLYSNGAKIKYHRLALKTGFIDLVYFTIEVPTHTNQKKADQTNMSTVIPVYADGSYQLPEGIE